MSGGAAQRARMLAASNAPFDWDAWNARMDAAADAVALADAACREAHGDFLKASRDLREAIANIGEKG